MICDDRSGKTPNSPRIACHDGKDGLGFRRNQYLTALELHGRSRSDHDGACQLVVPALLPTVECHPKDANSKHQKRRDVGQVPADTLRRRRVPTGTRIYHSRGNGHLAGRGLPAYPEQNDSSGWQYDGNHEVCWPSEHWCVGLKGVTVVVNSVDRDQNGCSDNRQQQDVNDACYDSDPETSVLVLIHACLAIRSFRQSIPPILPALCSRATSSGSKTCASRLSGYIQYVWIRCMRGQSARTRSCCSMSRSRGS